MRETICWTCKNYAKCSWSRGVPVEGWDATPTICDILIRNGEPERYIESFCVHSCPCYEDEDKMLLSAKELARFLGVGAATVYLRHKQPYGELLLQAMVEEKGYKLCDISGKKIKKYYLKKMEGVNEGNKS